MDVGQPTTSKTKSPIGLFRFASQKLLLARRDIYHFKVFGRSELWCYAKRGQGWMGYDPSIVFEIRSSMLGA